ncbi:CGNR zinc finger domain-containing protein [Amycolatopsis sp. NPDC004368]
MHTDATLVVDFLNTVDIERGEDLLDDPGQWLRWSADRGLTPSRPHNTDEARAIRDALRAAIGDPRVAREPFEVPLIFSLGADGPQLRGEDTVSAVLVAATRLAIRGDWVRLKICPADDCLEAFYDESRNRSRTWCSMRVCGNREKARTWRARATGVHN